MKNYNETEIDKAYGFLQSQSQVLSTGLRTDMSNGSIRVLHHIGYIRKEITGGAGTIQLITAKTDKVDGISTFNGKKLDSGEAVVFNAIAVGFKHSANQVSPAALSYGSTEEPAIRNAKLIVSQGPRKIVELPLLDLIRADRDMVKPEDRYYNLGDWYVLADEQAIDIDIKFPEDVSVPVTANEHDYIEVLFKGYQTIDNK
ncbi:hypothetical protein [Aquimarina litoralis]|uniref:hypothetical protein n=1 Tax=Aquimarina litoralis TaxID=584605 RepID=UPI001C584469|nr:hypothetical protein [Aquimarina litoralis]MBW1296432.1 hypothetical protein [Aquimarina litoralis]